MFRPFSVLASRCFVLAVLVGAYLLTAAARGQIATTSPADAGLPVIKIALVGDSTVTSRAGWGDGFTACFSNRVQVTNLSRAGRSSMSFINEGVWKKCLDLKPDYVLIQFGHNDQKLNDPRLGTEPKTTYRKYMIQFVDEARAAGIAPVLVTSLSRREWGADGKIHSTLVPYVEVVRQIAAEKNVPLIDLHAMSIELYERLGQKEVDGLSARKVSTAPAGDPTATKSTVIDGTHLNARGSIVIGKIVASELLRVVPALTPYASNR